MVPALEQRAVVGGVKFLARVTVGHEDAHSGLLTSSEDTVPFNQRASEGAVLESG